MKRDPMAICDVCGERVLRSLSRHILAKKGDKTSWIRICVDCDARAKLRKEEGT